MTLTNYLYVLKLINNKFYIGKSKYVFQRIDNHFLGIGSQWTKIYKPLNIIEVIPKIDNFDEDKKVKQYMCKYGIDNVRGGSYSNINLSITQKEFLQKEIYTATDKCFNCGSDRHFYKKCNIKK